MCGRLTVKANELITMRWGLIPRWWSKTLKDAKMATFNARAETIETKPFFRDAFKRSRCLIPMSGYYEWQDTPGGKQPWYFTARDGSPLLTAAGLWDEWKDRADRRAAQVMHDDHHRTERFRCGSADRMPVFLREEQFAPWLSGRRSWNSEACSERLSATLASVEAGQQFEG